MAKRIHWKIWENKVRPKMVKLFASWNIMSCEIKFQGCKGGLYTGFAHSKRRGDIYTMEDMEEVILACSFCHSVIDGKQADPTKLPEKYFWSKNECTEFVKQKIQERMI